MFQTGTKQERNLRPKKCGCSSSGRAPPCQGGGSEFEPRQPLQKRKHRLKVGAFCFIRRITPSPLRGHTRTFRHSCGLDAGGEIDPNPGTGDFRPGRAGAFCRLRRRGVRTLRRAGSVPPSAAGELLPGGSRGLQKGVQDTRTYVPVSYTPSCDSP